MGFFSRKKDAPEEVDLREVVDLREPVRFEFGFPTRCPACNSRGYLDHIDPFKRKQFEHCTACGLQWDLEEAEILALS